MDSERIPYIEILHPCCGGVFNGQRAILFADNDIDLTGVSHYYNKIDLVQEGNKNI